MANPFTKGWKYLMAMFDTKLEEHADPEIQIRQATEAAQQQHTALQRQAATVLGQQRQLELQLHRQQKDVEETQTNIRQALTMADQARAAGDTQQAETFEQTAEALAADLVTTEQRINETRTLHQQAQHASAQAKQAAQQSSTRLQQRFGERDKLLAQLQQTKMQEKTSSALATMEGITADANTPSLDQMRDKIERRYATALGTAELAHASTAVREAEVQHAANRMAGQSRLASIRAQMQGEITDGT